MVSVEMLLYIILSFHFVYADTPPGETYKFVAKDWKLNIPVPNAPRIKYANKGASIALNCTTNDPDAKVSILKRPGTNDPFVDARSGFGDRMKQVAQTFVILEITFQDSQIYKCLASSKNGEIEMELGTLIVKDNQDIKDPEILPGKDIIELEEGRRQSVFCKTSPGKGTVDASFLKWFRDPGGGNLVAIDSSRINREEEVKSDGTYIDIEELIFPNFSDSDIGKYVCQRKVGSNAPTQKAVEVKKSANVAPVVVFPEVDTSVIYISGMVIQSIDCEVGGTPKPKKYWKKDGKVVQDCPNIGDSSCILTLIQTNHKEHSGIYECHAENIVSTVKKSLDIQVKVSPTLEKASKTYVANNDDDYELYCVVTAGNPYPMIQWFYQEDSCANQNDCKPLETDWKPFPLQVPDANTATNFSYIVSNATKTNFFFRCDAKNMESKDTHTFKLIRQAVAPPQFSLLPKTDNGIYEINEADELKISCSSDVYVYSGVVLQKDGQSVASVTTVTNSLRQTNFSVITSQLSDQGKYECVGTLKRGGIKTEEINVKVAKLEAPTIKNFEDRRVSQADKNILITCETEGNPPPTVSWKFKGESLKDKPIITDINRCSISKSGIFRTDKENEIVICDMHYKMHNGTYECTATNKVSSSSKQMNFFIEAKPNILDWKSEVIVETSGTKEITCEVEANPPANVTWTRLDPTTNSSIYISSSMSVDILILGNILNEDGGIYICTGTSKLGVVIKYIEIKVKGGAGSIIGTDTGKAITGVIVAAVIVLLIAFLGICWYRRHLKKRYALFLEPNEKFIMDPDRSLFDQSNDLPYDMAFEFPRERLVFLKTLGSGAFGEVWLAEAEGIHNFQPRDKSASATKRRKSLTRQRRRYHSISVRYKKQSDQAETTLEKTMVAVKTLKEGAAEDEYKDLASELKILIHLGEHKNIVNLLGACTLKGSLCVILECCPHGSLLNFLRSKRDIFQPIWAKHDTDMENECTYIDLIMIAFQITKGMDFLQTKKLVHRDLASRNVLVGEDYIMKIADFGLARDIYKDEFYLKQTTGLLPVKWMAPESLFDKVYTSMSDVWSFGIVFWEIFTLGGSPYPGLPTEDLFSFLQDGKRMDRPEICPEEVYKIMMDCWEKSPYERPLFTHIGEMLSNVLKQNVQNDTDYLDFTDTGANDDYLQPETNGLQKEDSNEYLEATGTGSHYSSPKGQTYVPPPPPENGFRDQDSPLPPVPADGYVPMTPADHYKSPSFRYEDPQSIVV